MSRAISGLSIIFRLKSLLSLVKIEKSSKDGESLEHKRCSWIAVTLILSISTFFPVRCEVPKCSQIWTLKWLQSSNKYAPLLTENRDDFIKCKATIIASANSKKPYQKPLFSNNDKLVIHFEWKKRPDICVTENYVKHFIPVTISGNSNYPSILKNGHKTIVAGDSHVKGIRRTDFNKELRNGKACFCSFSGAFCS